MLTIPEYDDNGEHILDAEFSVAVKVSNSSNDMYEAVYCVTKRKGRRPEFDI